MPSASDPYERELKVPYFLLFYPEAQEMTLFHHTGKKYVTVPANAAGRCAIPELELEVGILDGWVRFWHQGRLLPLPADLQRELDEARRQLRQAQAQLRQAKDETERLRAQLRQLGVEPQS